MKRMLLPLAIAVTAAAPARADCVINQTSATFAQVLDSDTLLLSGGLAGHTLIKTLTPLMQGARFSIVKGNFCDYSSDAIYMNGNPVTTQQVAHVY